MSEEDVRLILTPALALLTTEEVFRLHGAGKVVLSAPRKLAVNIGEGERANAFFAKGSYIPGWEVAGYRLFSFFPNNLEKGLPLCFDYMWLCDATDGRPFALIDERWMSALRTGAEIAVGAKYLARPDANILGVVGAGLMARGALSALAQALKLEQVRVTDLVKDARESFARQMEEKLGINICAMDSIDETVTGADLVVLATSAERALISRPVLKEGIFLASLGTGQEIEPELLLAADKFVTDDWESCCQRNYVSRMLSEGQLTRDNLYAELGQVVAGTRPGRESDKEKIVLLTQGIASADLALAFRVYEEAKKKGLGKKLTL